jgi:transglutaminase/protease-like cytokinesis protein 3
VTNKRYFTKFSRIQFNCDYFNDMDFSGSIGLKIKDVEKAIQCVSSVGRDYMCF